MSGKHTTQPVTVRRRGRADWSLLAFMYMAGFLTAIATCVLWAVNS